MPVLEPGLLEAFGLYLLRTSAMVLAAPVFLMGTGFTGYKIALIMSLSLVLFGASGEPLPGEIDTFVFAAMALRELLIGFALAFVLQLCVLAVKVAGQLVGHEMGFAMAGQIDPETGIQVPLITRIWENVFLVGLLGVNGHHWLIRALADTFRHAKPGKIGLEDGLFGAILELFGSMFRAGLTFAAPVMLLLTLVSLMIGLLTRAVPYLNILELSFSIDLAVRLWCLVPPGLIGSPPGLSGLTWTT